MRYGSFHYGSDILYGQDALSTQVWALFIDWNGDGTFENVNEAVRMVGMTVRRGRQYLLKANGSGLENVNIGRLVIQLENHDGRYNPHNIKSPLYPNIRPGAKLHLKTRLPESTVIYSVFAGQIEDIIPISGAADRVQIIAVDGLKRLEDQDVVLHTQVNKSLDELIETTLTEAGWPWTMDLESSTDVIPWFWAPANMNARTLLSELASAYLGAFFAGADGAAKFYNRNHDFQAAKLRLEQDQLSTEIMLRSPWEVVRNTINLICHPRANKDLAVVLWELLDKPQVDPDETYEVWGNLTLNGQDVPISGYQAPVINVDYAVNTQPDGSGTNINVDCTVNATVYANKVRYQVTNNSAQTGYIQLLQLRGDPLHPSTASFNAADEDSKNYYGIKTFTIDSYFLQNSNLIADLANALLALLKDTQSYPTIKIIGRPESQFTVDLFDNVDLIIDRLGVADTFRIGNIEHQWVNETGQVTQTTFQLEPVNNALSLVWTFPTEIGISSIFTF